MGMDAHLQLGWMPEDISNSLLITVIGQPSILPGAAGLVRDVRHRFHEARIDQADQGWVSDCHRDSIAPVAS